ncbi:MAG: glycosyltransferase family 2 protein [Gemmatimonadota bacterium]|nr:glycosyltransferase family 2 protein [Gemmatimonadota bacterium]
MSGGGAEHGSQPMGPKQGMTGDPHPGPLISVVIVNWNACGPLERAMRSMFERHPGLELEVRVVDNASTDGSVAMLGEKFPSVGVFENPENRGFAAAVNQAFSKVDPHCPYVLVLNPDVEFTEEATLDVLIDFLRTHDEAQVVTPRIVDLKGRFQRVCRRREPAPGTLLARLLGLDRLFPHSPVFAAYTYGNLPESAAHSIDSASGSFMLFERQVLDRIGGFDERFFMYAEDLDWCRRARQEGFGIYYYPAAVVVHLGRASSRQRPLRSLWHLHRTAVQYMAKYHSADYSFLLRTILATALAAHFLIRASVETALRMFTGPGKVKAKTARCR